MAVPTMPETVRAVLIKRNNIIAIAAAAALSAASLNPSPIILLLAAEAGYIAYVIYGARLSHGSPLDRPNKDEHEIQNKQPAPLVSISALQRIPATKAADKNESSSVDMRETARPFPQRRKEKTTSGLPSFMDFPIQNTEGWGEQTEIQRAFHSIENKVSRGAPKTKELLDKLEALMHKHELFVLKEQELTDMVYSLAQEAKNIREHLSIKSSATTAPAGRKLEFSVGGVSVSEIARNIERAHEHYDKELEEIAWNAHIEDSATRTGLEQRKQSLLNHKREIDQIGKVLANIHFTLNLLVKKFKQIDTELESSSPYDIIVETDRLIGQTNVVMQLIEEVQANELSIAEAVA